MKRLRSPKMSRRRDYRRTWLSVRLQWYMRASCRLLTMIPLPLPGARACSRVVRATTSRPSERPSFLLCRRRWWRQVQTPFKFAQLGRCVARVLTDDGEGTRRIDGQTTASSLADRLMSPFIATVLKLNRRSAPWGSRDHTCANNTPDNMSADCYLLHSNTFAVFYISVSMTLHD